MFLVDTNIFLEILLGQEKEVICRDFLVENVENLGISDFSLYSIGVILSKIKRIEVFEEFVGDVLPLISVIVLDRDLYGEIIRLEKEKNMDFDDSYQVAVAKYHDLKIVTMDSDFKQVADEVEVIFL